MTSPNSPKAPPHGSGRTVITDVLVVDGSPSLPYKADVAIAGHLIVQVGDVLLAPGDAVVQGRGRTLMPGLIDAHSHADGRLFDPLVQLALLRQGVTTVIGGQDGVSFAPGDGSYATEYFAAINGPHPTYQGGGVAELLATFDETTPLNFGYLVPAGTVRYEVLGRKTETANPAERESMRALVSQGMDDGALGLSSGLDYVPGIFADADELADLCRPVAAAGGIYVTHMRGGYEDNSAAGVVEIQHIATTAGVRAHISHFHARAEVLTGQLTSLAAAGVDTTFDAYPYTRGCSLLSMPLLPPELSVLSTTEILSKLAQPDTEAALRREWFPQIDHNASLGPNWPRLLTLAHVAAPEFRWTHGLSLEEAAERDGVDAIGMVLAILRASRLEVNVVMQVPHERDDDELAQIFTHPGHMAGSDGIFIGAHPHPRARGTFARYLGRFAIERGDYDLATAIRHLATGPAERFSLGRRGRIAADYLADMILVDQATVSDQATYAAPNALATGIDDVFVAGVQVLSEGALTGALAGSGLRRAGSVASRSQEN